MWRGSSFIRISKSRKVEWQPGDKMLVKQKHRAVYSSTQSGKRTSHNTEDLTKPNWMKDVIKIKQPEYSCLSAAVSWYRHDVFSSMWKCPSKATVAWCWCLWNSSFYFRPDVSCTAYPAAGHERCYCPWSICNNVTKYETSASSSS